MWPGIGNCVAKFVGVVGYIVQYGCVTHCALEYLGDFVICTGPSMEPTLFSNDILLTEHITPRFESIKKGDIVIAKSPSNPRMNVCKRVTGMPGDKVILGFSTHVVPRGHVWLEGDNRSNSTDSRIYGPVPQGLIRGRAVCRVWPPKEMKMLTYKEATAFPR
ncbi:hypothetical protein L9F63_003681 [Diploptera punctata]|uniref:Mitochondrial inner membrane protease subunit n=1 Tax=Diploptera punctata TaxID=6984 RepID=A0AAD7ZKD7_DIPPU|nr:hypothetical protein L9F63_003681 [Diploptera punctata]